MSSLVCCSIILIQREASPGAMPAPEFIIILSATPGFAYAVKPLVGTPSLFAFSKLLIFPEFLPSEISKPSSLIRREFQFSSESLDSPSSRQFHRASRHSCSNVTAEPGADRPPRARRTLHPLVGRLFVLPFCCIRGPRISSDWKPTVPDHSPSMYLKVPYSSCPLGKAISPSRQNAKPHVHDNLPFSDDEIVWVKVEERLGDTGRQRCKNKDVVLV